MKEIFAWLFTLSVLVALIQNTNFEKNDIKSDEYVGIENNLDEAGVFSWSLKLFDDEFYPSAVSVLKKLGITRIYQNIPIDYLQQESTSAMVQRFASEGIEVIAVIGEKEWGLPNSDKEWVYKHIDLIADYNSGIGKSNPIRKIALDVETYICDEWNNNPKEYFKEYVFAMHNIYLYAHKVGFEVVQVIPTFYDTVDETLFKILISSCCDEVSLMNYAKTVQVSSIEQEIELCRKSGKRVETIFETQPHSEEYSVSEKNSYFCDGLPVLESVRDKIFETYQYENLYASYHTFESIYYMVTGENID